MRELIKKYFWARYVLAFVLTILVWVLWNNAPSAIQTGNSPEMLLAYLAWPIPYLEFFLMIGGLAGHKTIGLIVFIFQLIILAIFILLVIYMIDW